MVTRAATTALYVAWLLSLLVCAWASLLMIGVALYGMVVLSWGPVGAALTPGWFPALIWTWAVTAPAVIIGSVCYGMDQ